MPILSFAVIAYPSNKLLTEENILEELDKSENSKILYFESRDDALRYCQIAPLPKYIFSEFKQHKYNQSTHKEEDLLDEHSSVEERNQFAQQFYDPLSDPVMLAHQAESSFLILETEINADGLLDPYWPSEEYYYAIQNRNYQNIDLCKQRLLTLTDKPYTPSSEPTFQINCRKGQRTKILSLIQAEKYQSGITTSLSFSNKQKKLSLLRDYVTTFAENKLVALANITNLIELSILFSFLQERKQHTPEQLLAAKENFIAYFLKTLPSRTKEEDVKSKIEISSLPSEQNQIIDLPPIQETLKTPNKPTDKKIPGWQLFLLGVLVLLTAGIALIFIYFILFYKKDETLRNVSQESKPDENISTQTEPVKIEPAPPIKKIKHNLEIEQQVFNFDEVRDGMYKHWKNRATIGQPIGHRSCSEKAHDYQDKDQYKHHLQEKQKSLDFNKRDELRKRVEFLDDDKVLVTGTHEQLKRWGLYASFSKNKLTHEELKSKLEKSWSKSGADTRDARLKLRNF